jgi:cell division protein FtsB
MAGFFQAMGELMNSRRKWVRAAVIVTLAYLVFSGNRGLWNLYRLHQEKQNLNEQIVHLKNEINRYQAEYQTYAKNNTIVEKQAREELSLVKPGEIVYKFAKTGAR